MRIGNDIHGDWPSALVMLTAAQQQELKRLLDESEFVHHQIMAKMGDPKFDLLRAWERKESLDSAIGACIRKALHQ